MFFLLAAIGLILVSILWTIYAFNVLVHARNKVDEAFSGIDVQLKQRHDLVPNLVEVVRGYAQHEQELLTRTAAARSQAIAATAPGEIGPAEDQLAGQLRSVIGVAEGYPALQASEEYKKLMSELREVEDEIQASRSLYNQNVKFFNDYAQSFPASLVAGRTKPAQYPFLQFDRVDEDVSQLVAKGFAA